MEKKKRISSSRAITLVALVITIIIMLILVAVSVQILIESNLIGMAENTADKMKAEQENESNLSGVTIGGRYYNSIDEYIKSNPESEIGVSITLGHEPVDVTVGGNVSEVTSEGVPIPVGYRYVEGTKDTGVVITDAEESVTVAALKEDSIRIANEELTGNEFVWVPVLQNQRIEIEVKLESNITGITITDPLGASITTDMNGNEIVASGTGYSGKINPTINGTYKVKVEAENEEETVEKTLKVSTLYAQDFWIDYENMTADEAKNYTDSTIADYVSSVNKYGGFYIARYEAGSENNRCENKTSTTVYSQKNKYPFNYVTQSEAIELAKTVDKGSASVTSELVNAAAWDRTMNWLVETKAITMSEMLGDSTSWGNYANSEKFDITGYYSINAGNSWMIRHWFEFYLL